MKKLLGCVCALIAINSFAAWSYNSDTSTITDGNWELVCSKGTGEKELIIGVAKDWNNAYKAGSGVLDLTTFEENTGYKIVKFNNWAFNVAGTSGNANLIGVICPTATIISKNAFAYCKKITMISFPEVIEIGNNAFYGCTGLSEDVEFPKLKILNFEAFRGCKNLKRIVIPANVQRIGNNAFVGCVALEDIVIKGTLCYGLFLISRDIVQYFQSMREIFLMSLAINAFHALKFTQLRKNMIQQAHLIKQSESHRRP